MFRSMIGAAIVVVSLAVSGCTFSPVYSDGSPINAASLAFDLGSPTSRLEQVVYQELSLRFATSTAPNTPKLVVSVAPSIERMTMTNAGAGPASVAIGTDAFEATVNVTATATLNGEQIFTATRRASAQFTQNDQVLANRNAEADALERATKAATESLRLAILAKFPNNSAYRPAN